MVTGKKYYLYKITNNINGKFYIGRRECSVAIENDNYFGSGKRLKAAIRKYGKESFTKEVIQEYNSYSDLIEAETTIVDKSLVLSSNCYNLARGGHGGYTYYADRKFQHTAESKAKISKANTGRKRPDLVAKNLESGFSKYWVGRNRTASDKQKKSVAAKKRLQNEQTDFNQTVQCPHCSKLGQKANMMRWHFDKCKSLLK